MDFENDSENGFIKVTGLWKKQTKDGVTYLAGKLTEITDLSIMPNKFKKSEAHPDYYMLIRAKKVKTPPQSSTPFVNNL